jgi:hypothetical protein
LKKPDVDLLKELLGEDEYIVADINKHDILDISPDVIRLMQPTFDRILRIGTRIDKKERGELTNQQRAYMKACIKAKRKGLELPPSPFKKRRYKQKCHPEDSGNDLE